MPPQAQLKQPRQAACIARTAGWRSTYRRHEGGLFGLAWARLAQHLWAAQGSMEMCELVRWVQQFSCVDQLLGRGARGGKWWPLLQLNPCTPKGVRRSCRATRWEEVCGSASVHFRDCSSQNANRCARLDRHVEARGLVSQLVPLRHMTAAQQQQVQAAPLGHLDVHAHTRCRLDSTCRHLQQISQ